jgi:hypothetical protein
MRLFKNNAAVDHKFLIGEGRLFKFCIILRCIQSKFLFSIQENKSVISSKKSVFSFRSTDIRVHIFHIFAFVYCKILKS